MNTLRQTTKTTKFEIYPAKMRRASASPLQIRTTLGLCQGQAWKPNRFVNNRKLQVGMQGQLFSTARASYENPLVSRYASKEMNFNWSPQKKFTTWRRLWIALAQAQKELGLDITDEQINEMRNNLENINFEVAEAKEKELRHDVMSHIHAFGQQCPKAMPIIHLGATSCFVGDNTDLIQMKDGLVILQKQLLLLIHALREMAVKYKDLPTLGFTHYQPAQLTTVGKRATLWLQDLLFDYNNIHHWIHGLPFLGVKGTTGTQASFMELFNGDHEKVKQVEQRVTKAMGFSHVIPVSGQTYTRKLDFFVLSALSGLAQSINKMAVDIRLLMNLREIEEPFETKQVGSSAMPYKRNPMRCERMCALARYVISLNDNAANTHANQWFERTLDDSANRRLTLPQAFLSADIMLRIALNVIDGIQVWPLVIRKHIDAELPFMATENILMACVKAGGNRQELHEAIREHSMEAGRRVKEEGKENDLLARIEADSRFAAVKPHLATMLNPSNFIGRSVQQVEEFVKEEVDPLLAENRHLLVKTKSDVTV
jgi:adenylosuccinate lyase